MGTLGELVRKAEEVRIAVSEMTKEVAEEEFNTVPNIFDEPTAGQVLPTFEGLHYLQIDQYFKIFLSYKFVYKKLGQQLLTQWECWSSKVFSFLNL